MNALQKIMKLGLAGLLAGLLAGAALHSRLGGKAYYDDEANLTWLQDANAAVAPTAG